MSRGSDGVSMIDVLPEFDAASLYAMCEVGNKNTSEQRCCTHVIKEHDTTCSPSSFSRRIQT